jgi:hypothetical protein
LKLTIKLFSVKLLSYFAIDVLNQIETLITIFILQIAGRESEVIGESCDENGIKKLEFSSMVGDGPVFHYKPPSEDTFQDQPLISNELNCEIINTLQSEFRHFINT